MAEDSTGRRNEFIHARLVPRGQWARAVRRTVLHRIARGSAQGHSHCADHKPLDPEPIISTICLPQGPNTGCEVPGPGGGPGSGPGTVPARADHHVAGPRPVGDAWAVIGERAPPSHWQRRARQPPCSLQRWARLPQGSRSKQPAQRSRQRSRRPGPITERGKEEIPGQAARTVEPQAAAITAVVKETRAGHGAGRRELPSQAARIHQPPRRSGGVALELAAGWCGQGQFRPTASSRRRHAGTSPRWKRQGLRPLAPGQTHYACGNLELLRPPGRLGLPSSRPELYATLLATHRRARADKLIIWDTSEVQLFS